jgi:hypothetical protein
VERHGRIGNINSHEGIMADKSSPDIGIQGAPALPHLIVGIAGLADEAGSVVVAAGGSALTGSDL